MSESSDSSATASLRTVGRNTAILFGSQSITWMLAAVVLAVFPRFIGPVPMGQYVVAYALWAIANSVVPLGTSTLVTLESARDHDQAGRLIGPVVRARTLSLVAAWIFVVGLATAIGYSKEIVVLAALAGLGYAVEVILGPMRSALVGLERMADLARVDITSALVATAALVTVVVVTRNIYLVVAVAPVPALVATFMLYPRLARATTIRFATTWPDVRSVVRRGSPFLLAGVALIAYQQVDVIVMSLLIDKEQIGWYGAADRLFGTLLFAPAIVTTALLPALTREHTRDPATALTILGRAFDLLMIIAIPIGLITTFSAHQFTLILFGDEFEGAGPILAVHGVVLMLTFFSILFGQYAFAIGRQAFWNALMIGAIGATIVFDLVLVPWADREFDNGAIGGVLSYVVTEGGMALIGCWKIAPQIVTARRMRRVGKCAVAGGCFVGAAWFIRDRFFVLPVLAGLVAYAVAVIALRAIDRDELTALRSLGPNRRGSRAEG